MEGAPGPIDEARLLAQMGWVRGLAARLVADPGLAEDVAQETWLAARRSTPTHVEGERSLRAWLGTVVRNRVRRAVRGDRRRRDRERRAARPEVLEPTADLVARGAAQRELSRLVMELEEPARSAILLRYLDECSTAEVAERQGITPAAARKRLSRAVESLRRRLDAEHGGDRAAWTLALLPLARTAPAPAAAAGAAVPTLLGVLVVNTKLFGALAVVTLLAWLVGTRWLAEGPGDPGPGPSAPLARDAGPDLGPGSAASGGPASDVGRTAAAGAGTVGVRVLDPAGRPLPRARLLVLRGAELEAEAVTDGDGRAQLDAMPAPEDEVLVLAPAHAPARRPWSEAREDADAGAREHRLALPPGRRLEGRVAGWTPGDVLVLHGDRVPAALRDLGPAARARLDELGYVGADRPLTVDDDGTLRCAGLPADWSGSVVAPAGTRIAAGARPDHVLDGRELLLLEPRADVRLELVRLLRVRGTLVDAADGGPLTGLHLVARLGTEGRPRTELLEATSGPRGDFRLDLPLRAGDPRVAGARLELRVLEPEAGGARWSFEGAALAADGDLGALAVDLGGVLEFRVVDAAGAPVAGAVGTVEGPATPTAVTDAEGRGRLLGVRGESVALTVARPGYGVARATARVGGTTLVTLRAARSLLVTARDGAGEVPADVRVRVRAEDRAWEGADGHGWLDPDALAPGEARPGTREQLEAPLELDARGQLALGPLRAGIRLEVCLLSDAGAVLDRRTVVTPPATAGARPLEVELRAPDPGPRLAGRVVDPGGRPLPRARLHVEDPHGARRVETDADGRFELGPFRGPVTITHLEASRPGYATRIVRDLRLEEDAPELVLELEPARRLTVTLEDELGRHPRPTLLHAATDDGRAFVGTAGDAPGTFVFEALPRRPATVSAELAGVVRECPVGPTDATARLVLPATGTLRCAVAPDHGPAPGAWLRVDWARVEGGEVVAEDGRFLPRRPDGWDPVEFDLPAGTYRVQLSVRDLAERRTDPLGPPREVEVGGGLRTGLDWP